MGQNYKELIFRFKPYKTIQGRGGTIAPPIKNQRSGWFFVLKMNPPPGRADHQEADF
jgi:hypothetical protein